MLSKRELELAQPVIDNVSKLPEDGLKVFEIAVMAYMLGRDRNQRSKESPRHSTAAAR